MTRKGKGYGVPENQTYFVYETGFCRITIVSDSSAVLAVLFGNAVNPGGKKEASALTDLAAEQLVEYFAGKRKQFDVPIRPVGTDFQEAVWKALLNIPYGETRSYKQIAQEIGSPAACRAVGMANNKNPISIIIPCHRVIGSNGALVGYGGGLEMKQKLLALEQK